MSSNALPVQQSNIIPFPTHGKSSEWYTPAYVMNAVRGVIGPIELDPASCEAANQVVKATRYFTEQENGLAQEWKARSAWLNPPFGRQNAPLKGFGGGKSIMGMFVAKLVQAYQSGDIEEAIALVTNKADTQWFEPLWDYPLCFCTHRVLFNRPSDTREGHFFGTVFAYLGTNEQAFISEFSKYGHIAKSIAGPRHETVQARLWGAV